MSPAVVAHCMLRCRYTISLSIEDLGLYEELLMETRRIRADLNDAFYRRATSVSDVR